MWPVLLAGPARITSGRADSNGLSLKTEDLESQQEGCFMKRFSMLVGLAAMVALSSHVAAADDASASPRVGEIRAFAIGRSSTDTVAELHQSGWIEARGQLLAETEFPELYRVVGRDWTATDVHEGQFAVPVVRDERYQRAVDTAYAYRVLAGEVVTGGRVIKSNSKLSPISYWIFTGRPVRTTDVAKGGSR
jgi:hypothetical protein